MGCHIFSPGLFPTLGGADNIGFRWLSVSVLYFEIKNIFNKVTPLLTPKLHFLLPTSAAENPLEKQDWNVPGISSAQVGVTGRMPKSCFLTCQEMRRKPLPLGPGHSPLLATVSQSLRAEGGGRGEEDRALGLSIVYTSSCSSRGWVSSLGATCPSLAWGLHALASPPCVCVHAATMPSLGGPYSAHDG